MCSVVLFLQIEFEIQKKHQFYLVGLRSGPIYTSDVYVLTLYHHGLYLDRRGNLHTSYLGTLVPCSSNGSNYQYGTYLGAKVLITATPLRPKYLLYNLQRHGLFGWEGAHRPRSRCGRRRSLHHCTTWMPSKRDSAEKALRRQAQKVNEIRSVVDIWVLKG